MMCGWLGHECGLVLNCLLLPFPGETSAVLNTFIIHSAATLGNAQYIAVEAELGIYIMLKVF